ncbi:MAG TPA: hypothetical protein VI306_20470 [Pyrinomonadaceae bacterium]
MYRQFLFACLTIFLLISSTYPQTAATKLEPGKTIERTIAPGESHSYNIQLAAKQYLQFVVEQHGVDVTVQVISPAGQTLKQIDSPNGTEGPENGTILSAADGLYTIVVAPLATPNQENKASAAGRYEIKIIELRDATEDELKVALGEELRKTKARALLNEVLESLPSLHQVQTRVRIKEQVGQLLLQSDQKQATKLLTEVIKEAQDFLQSLPLDTDDYYADSSWCRQVRYEVLQILATRDPEAALDLFIATRIPDDDSENPEVAYSPEAQYEQSLIAQVASKSPKRAYELAEARLKSGYSPQLIQTIQSLQGSDKDLAAKLTKAVTAKLLSEPMIDSPQAVEMMMSLLRVSSVVPNSGPNTNSVEITHLLSVEDQKALVRKALDEAFNFKGPLTDPTNAQRVSSQQLIYSLKSVPDLKLDEIVPGATAKIEKKMAEAGYGAYQANEEWSKYENALNAGSTDAALETLAQAPDYVRQQLMGQLAQKAAANGDISRAREIVNQQVKNPRDKQRMLIQLEQQLANFYANKGEMEEALRHVAKIPATSQRAELIGEFANRIGQGEKKAKALQLLETARSLVTTAIRPETSDQMIALYRLAGAFSHYDSQRALDLLEPLIQQFNELADAAKVLNGFGGDYFQNGELKLHDDNSLSQITPPMANSLGELSLIDFDKAKRVAEGITLPEVRLTLYLGMVQQVIGPPNPLQPSFNSSRSEIID